MANTTYLPGFERRRQILDVAKQVFAQRGYHDTNISHICDGLGIARGTLYQYFRGKKEVFSAIIEELLARVRAVIAAEPPIAIPDGVRPSREAVIAYTAASLRRTLEAVFEDEASLRLLVREAVGLDVQVDAILRAIDEIVADRFAADVGVAQRLGVLRDDVNPRTAALFILGGVQKVALDALTRDGKVDLRALSLEVTRLNMLGLLREEVQ